MTEETKSNILVFGGGNSDKSVLDIDKNATIIGSHTGIMKGQDWTKQIYWENLSKKLGNNLFNIISIDSGSSSWLPDIILPNIIKIVKTNLNSDGIFMFEQVFFDRLNKHHPLSNYNIYAIYADTEKQKNLDFSNFMILLSIKKRKDKFLTEIKSPSELSWVDKKFSTLEQRKNIVKHSLGDISDIYQTLLKQTNKIEKKTPKMSQKKQFIFNNIIFKGMLSIQQPSASLIIEGYKNIENRTWGPTKWNSGWVLVHSPKSFEKVDLYKSEYITKILRKIDWENLPTSCIIGAMHISKIERNCTSNSVWAGGKVCWHIDNVIKFPKTIPETGSQGIYNPDISLYPEIKEQLDLVFNNTINTHDFTNHIERYCKTMNFKYLDFLNNVEKDEIREFIIFIKNNVVKSIKNRNNFYSLCNYFLYEPVRHH